MAQPHPPCDMSNDDGFYKQGGITNGAAWYSVAGGEQGTALCQKYMLTLPSLSIFVLCNSFNNAAELKLKAGIKQ